MDFLQHRRPFHGSGLSAELIYAQHQGNGDVSKRPQTLEDVTKPGPGRRGAKLAPAEILQRFLPSLALGSTSGAEGASSCFMVWFCVKRKTWIFPQLALGRLEDQMGFFPFCIIPPS